VNRLQRRIAPAFGRSRHHGAHGPAGCVLRVVAKLVVRVPIIALFHAPLAVQCLGGGGALVLGLNLLWHLRCLRHLRRLLLHRLLDLNLSRRGRGLRLPGFALGLWLNLLRCLLRCGNRSGRLRLRLTCLVHLLSLLGLLGLLGLLNLLQSLVGLLGLMRLVTRGGLVICVVVRLMALVEDLVLLLRCMVRLMAGMTLLRLVRLEGLVCLVCLVRLVRLVRLVSLVGLLVLLRGLVCLVLLVCLALVLLLLLLLLLRGGVVGDDGVSMDRLRHGLLAHGLPQRMLAHRLLCQRLLCHGLLRHGLVS